MAGGQILPESGPTWQAMRLSRNRNWGHPVLLDYLVDLSEKAARLDGWKGLYIGDLLSLEEDKWSLAMPVTRQV